MASTYTAGSLQFATFSNGAYTFSTTTNASVMTYPTWQVSVISTGNTVLPLREPKREPYPGWLAPDGRYYACDYSNNQRHSHTAAAIIDKYPELRQSDTSEEWALLNQHWLRLDYETVLPNDGKLDTTDKQLATLRFLLKLMGDDGWNQHAKASIRRYIQAVMKQRAETTTEAGIVSQHGENSL